MKGDFHLHTRFSMDGSGEPRDFARLAADRGFEAIGISEHADFDPADIGHGFLKLDAYQRVVEAIEVPDLEVLCGVEIHYQPRYEAEIRAFLEDFDGDYVIGSVHFVDGLAMYEEATFRRHDLERLYGRYRELHAEMLATGLFDVVGHLDFPKRYGPLHMGGDWPSRAIEPHLLATLTDIAQSDVLLEINTGGLRGFTREPSPSLDLARTYADLGGGRVVLGSDAHHPGDLGFGFSLVEPHLQAAGLEIVGPTRA